MVCKVLGVIYSTGFPKGLLFVLLPSNLFLFVKNIRNIKGKSYSNNNMFYGSSDSAEVVLFPLKELFRQLFQWFFW